MGDEQNILIAKCKEPGVKDSGKERLASLRKKLEALGVNFVLYLKLPHPKKLFFTEV